MSKFSKWFTCIALFFLVITSFAYVQERNTSGDIHLIKTKKTKKQDRNKQNLVNQQPLIFQENLSALNINDSIELYIDLLKKILVNTIYEDISFIDDKYDSFLRENGRDHPKIAHTMIGVKRLDNIHYCLKQIIENNIPGDCIETGVWRGGATIMMRGILKAYNDTSRKVWVADSFEGVPLTNPDVYPADKGFDIFHDAYYFSVSLEEVKKNFSKYGLLDNQVIFLKGFFKDTLPIAPITKLSLLRLDGDLYESTMDALVNLYPKLSSGGYIIIDDFNISACVAAVHDYRRMMNINEPITWIDDNGVFWKKD